MNKNKDSEIRLILAPLRILQFIFLYTVGTVLIGLAFLVMLLYRGVEYVSTFANGHSKSKLDLYPFKIE